MTVSWNSTIAPPITRGSRKRFQVRAERNALASIALSLALPVVADQWRLCEIPRSEIAKPSGMRNE